MKFTADDFDKMKYGPDTRPCEAYSEYANSKLQSWLDSALTVYLDKHDNLSLVDEIGFTKKGKIVCIEEIKKECEHKRVCVDVELNYQMQCPITRKWRFDENEVIFFCRDCKISLKPDWKVK